MNSKKSSISSKKKNKNTFLYDFVKVTGSIPALIWMRPRWLWKDGKFPLKGGFLISSNHCSFVDPIRILCAFWKRRVYSLATKELYSSPLKNWFFNQMHCIQVDKDNFSVDSFHKVVKTLKAGGVVSIFPEGQLNLGAEAMSAFKSGMVLMAYTAKVPIVPAYLMIPKKWYSRMVVAIGAPIDVTTLCDGRPSSEDFEKISVYIHEKENELKAYCLEKCK